MSAAFRFPYGPPEAGAEERVYSVSALTSDIRHALEDAFGPLWVEGEISNLHRSGPGHLYFTLKDASAQIAAVMFRGSQAGLRVEPADGMLVRAHGRLGVYEPRGQYQLILQRLLPAGKGALQEAFEKLKARLAAEGLFDDARKRPIPLLPRHIGLVTSPGGAAIRDLLSVLGRRFPNLHIVLAPCRVQGAGAAAEIAAAIDLLNTRPEIEVMIVGRGGGSLEDLWEFNEEAVARAIARSRIPVISAVGHQTDFTISDFVADLRAPTPSAAAELVVERKDAFEGALRAGAERMRRALDHARTEARARLRAAAASHVFREPGHRLRQYRERLAARAERIARRVGARVQALQQRTDEWPWRAAQAARARRSEVGLRLGRLDAQLRALSPIAVLERGYSITRLDDGTLVRRAAQAAPGRRIRTRVTDGEFESQIAGVSEPRKTTDPNPED